MEYDDSLVDIAVHKKTLPRFIEKHNDEYVDWLKIIQEKFIYSTFETLTKTLKNKQIIDELRLIYVGFMYQEMAQSDVNMQRVIKWQLEEQFQTLPSSTNILGQIRQEIVQYALRNLEQRSKLQNSVEAASTVIDKLSCTGECQISTRDLFERLQMTVESCPLAIYNNSVKCFENFYEEMLPPTTNDKDVCYFLFRRVWVKCSHKKIQFKIRRQEYVQGFVPEFLQWFRQTLSPIKLTQNLYFGYFTFDKLDLDVVSFLDHIVMDSSFHYLVFDEHNITQKKWLTLHCRMGENTVVCNVNRKATGYTKVTFFNVENLLLVETLKLKLGKVFYYTQAHPVVDEYYKILPSLRQEQRSIDKPSSHDVKQQHHNRMLKVMVPELFLINYPRKCLHLPRILEPGETHVNAMRFPVRGEPTPPRWYTCNHHDKARYPGLRVNPLSNNADFPVIPCCYISDQRDKPGSEYRKYFLNDLVKSRKKINDTIVYSTNRIVPEGMTGVLPKKLRFIFYDAERQFHRFGVTHSPQSAIRCCSLATNEPEIDVDVNSPLVRNFCAHELAGAEASSDTTKGYSYFDVKLYYRWLEEVYNINIVLFENKRDSTTMSVVNVTRKYYCNFAWRPRTLFLLVNAGLEADTPEWPQCEIIGTPAQHLFTLEESSRILKLFDALNDVVRIPKRVGARKQVINEDGQVFFLDDELCDPPHPMYKEVPYRTTSSTADNPMRRYFQKLEMFEEEFQGALNARDSNMPMINTIVKSLSQRGIEYLKNRGHFLSSTDILFGREYTLGTRHFATLNAFKTFCTFKNLTPLSHPKLDNKKIWYLTLFDIQQLEEWIVVHQAFTIYSISWQNLDYFEVFQYIHLDGEGESVVHCDGQWFRRVTL